jgi:isocitrate dehydrogenase
MANYTKSQLLSILNESVGGNGLISLSQQLIAAKLNAAAGTTVPANVAMAITDADALIGGLVVPPVGSGFLSTSSTSSLTTTLDIYNNGDTPGGPPHCDD